MVDFFQQAALQTIMFYQLSSFDLEASESDLSFQVGVLQGVFTSAQTFTSLLWGKIADHPSWGRKRVVLISLVGQGISCLGLAFSRTFAAAVVWRLLGGAVNATVGGARTFLSEKTPKRYYSRTFLLLPLAWNIAQIVAPPISGALSNPVRYYPHLFGEDSRFGGRTGVVWLTTFPYALPSLFSALVLFTDALLVWTGLEETLAARLGKKDYGLELIARMKHFFSKHCIHRVQYTQVGQDEDSSRLTEEDVELQPSPRVVKQEAQTVSGSPEPPSTHTPSFLQAMTGNVLRVMTTVALFEFGQGGFTALWTIFLSSDRYDSQKGPERSLPVYFSGGLGFEPSTIGVAMSILGMVGIACQLILYPQVSARMGVLQSTKCALFLFPVANTLTPFLSLVFNKFLLWAGIVGVASINITARTFAAPGAVLLINNSTPRPEVLGTIHGLGASVQAASRTLGPMVVAWWYSDGIQRGMVGEAWWLLAVCGLVCCASIYWVRDGQ